MEPKLIRTRTDLIRDTYVYQGDVVHLAESSDELDVILLGTVLGQDTEMSLLSVQRLGALSQTTSKSVVDESLLKDSLKASNEVQLYFSFHSISINNSEESIDAKIM